MPARGGIAARARANVAAPYLAGLYARGGHIGGVVGPNTLYEATSSAFNDITFGQNAPPHACDSVPTVLCVARTGWDGPTGLGSPNGLAAF